MSAELFDMLRQTGDAYLQAMGRNDISAAQQVVRHHAQVNGLPDAAAESMLNEFSRQPIGNWLMRGSAAVV